MERANDSELETQPPEEEGGEVPCLAPMVCADCGVVLDGSPHRPDCNA
jgi:hypothetical protein